MMKIDKAWGHEEILITKPYVIKKLYVNAGHRLSLQYHKKKIETLIGISGMGTIRYDHTWVTIETSSIIHIPQMQVHRIEANRTTDLIIYEVSTQELDDVVRLEDDYGRVK